MILFFLKKKIKKNKRNPNPFQLFFFLCVVHIRFFPLVPSPSPLPHFTTHTYISHEMAHLTIEWTIQRALYVTQFARYTLGDIERTLTTQPSIDVLLHIITRMQRLLRVLHAMAMFRDTHADFIVDVHPAAITLFIRVATMYKKTRDAAYARIAAAAAASPLSPRHA